MINVSWHDVKEYVTWLSGKTGQTYRLLTEAEWEYATRAGTTTSSYFGKPIQLTDVSANRQKTVPVGSSGPANSFGIFDFHGNVWEWVEDCYSPRYLEATNGGAAQTSTCLSSAYRVVRGGSWDDSRADLRAALRLGLLPGRRDPLVGFRVARLIR